MAVPEQFKGAATQGAAATPSRLDPKWWKVFGDADLTTLEEGALKASPTLQVAAARVLEARAVSRSVKSQFFPLISADPSANRARSSGNEGHAPATGNNFTIPFDVTYEVDVWGRVQRSYENSQASAQAVVNDYAVVMLTLTADVAQAYFQLRGLDAQDELLRDSTDSYKKQIDLINRQLNAGIASSLDLAQAQALLSSAQAAQLDVQRQRADLEHALAVLTGRPPTDLAIAVNPLRGTPPAIPPGLPVDLLKRRPDVAEAEENLKAASANIGVATAAFYPTFQLTGAAGFESVDVQHLLDWGSRFWSIGPNVSIPLFEGGKLHANLDQAVAAYDGAAASYRGTVLTAFGDVEDALTDLHFQARESGHLGDAAKQSEEAYRLSDVLYHQGIDSYLQVIDAERTKLQSQQAWIQDVTQQYVSTVLLIKAMGGGWEDKTAGAASQPATLPGKRIDIVTTGPAMDATMPAGSQPATGQ
jgi:multidrug efflux system outer membrane protein